MRKQSLFLLAIPFLLSNCNRHLTAKTQKTSESTYVRETKKFLASIRTLLFPGDSILLVDKPPMHEFNDCLTYLFRDSLFTKPEQEIITAQISKPLLPLWDTTTVEKARIISRDMVSAILNDRKKGWNYFHKHVGGEFHSFSAPIFLRNYTLCLFYSDHACGGLCGSGQITLFKKENGKWTPFRSFCDWIS